MLRHTQLQHRKSQLQRCTEGVQETGYLEDKGTNFEQTNVIWFISNQHDLLHFLGEERTCLLGLSSMPSGFSSP